MIIYKIQNRLNGKVYIGKHCGDSDFRWKTHLKNSLDSSRSEHLYRAMKLYGSDNFEYEVLEKHPLSVGDEFLNEREIFYIKKFKSRSDENGYNMTDGGDGITAQFCSTETRKKMSESQDKFDYAAYNCLNGKLIKIFKKRDDIQKEFPQIRHVRHINHACNANNPNYKGKLYSNGTHPSGVFMWFKLPNGSTFPKKKTIIPGCLKRPRTQKSKIKGDDNEISQYSLSGNLIKTYPNVVTQVARDLGTQYSLITNAIEGKSSSHLNFLWRRYPKGQSPIKIEGIRDSKIVTFTKNQMTSLPIKKILDGKEVSKFESVVDALLLTDMKPTELFKSLNDGEKDSSGFNWVWI